MRLLPRHDRLVRLSESFLQTTRLGPLVRFGGTLPSVWSGKSVLRSAWPDAMRGHDGEREQRDRE